MTLHKELRRAILFIERALRVAVMYSTSSELSALFGGCSHTQSEVLEERLCSHD